MLLISVKFSDNLVPHNLQFEKSVEIMDRAEMIYSVTKISVSGDFLVTIVVL